jgi:hypothetical protein
VVLSTASGCRREVTVERHPEERQLLADLTADFEHLTPAETLELRQLQVAAIPAVPSYYSLATASAVPLYTGPILVPSADGKVPDRVEGTVSLELTPKPRVLMSGSVPTSIVVSNLLDGMAAPELPAMSTLPEPPQTPSKVGSASWHGPVRGCVVGKAAAATTVTFHLINFVSMHGGVITDAKDAWSGRVVATAGPWVVTIDARPDLSEIMTAMRDRGGYAVTHTCRLERHDGRRFSVDRCEQLLTCLTWCLWFCRAAASAVILPVGFDKDDRAMWSRWSAPHADPLPDTHWQWFDKLYGAEQLGILLPRFFGRWSDPVWQLSLQRAVRYYADASVMGTLQRNVVLAQVGLETLAFAHLVRSSQKLTAKQFSVPPVSKHIRQFLRDFGIPTTIPRTFYGLRAVRANSPWDGPAAIAWLRNDIVHAARHRVHGRRWKVWRQGWDLALWYLELGMLAVVEYDGRTATASQVSRT